MESKRSQNRKADRHRGAFIYMPAIISALLDYLLGNWMRVLKLVTVATTTWHIRFREIEYLLAKNKSTFKVSEENYHFEEC